MIDVNLISQEFDSEEVPKPTLYCSECKTGDNWSLVRISIMEYDHSYAWCLICAKKLAFLIKAVID